jgi:hypothetical protein
MANENYYELQQIPEGFAKADSATVASIVERQYRWWLDHTRGQRAQWRMNALFARGYQWAAMSTETQRIIVPPAPSSRKYVTINVLKPWALDTEAKLAINSPAFEVTPNTLDQEDKDGAIIGEKVGSHYWRQLELPNEGTQIVRQLLHFGNCYVETPWDQTIGPRFERQLPDGSTETTTKGDLRITVREPWNWFTDELPGDTDDKLFICMTSWMSIDKINNYWPDGDINTGEAVTAEADIAPMDDVSEILAQAYGTSVQPQTMVGEKEGAVVFKWMMKPQHSAPKGLIIYIANGKVLSREEWPAAYENLDGYPGQTFNWYTHPGQYRGTAPIEDQLPLQREINKTASQIRENMDAMLALKWMNPIGSGVEKINDLAGQLVSFNPGLMPTIAQPMAIPAHAFRYLSDLFNMLEDIQMLHKPSKGKVPAGVKSGVGIELLQEQDDRPLSVPEQAYHASLTQMFRKILQIVSVAADEERIIKITGSNRARQIGAFKGADLKGNTDIHLSVVGGSSKSKPAIVKKIMDMMQLGMFRDPSTKQIDDKRVMEMIRHAIPDVIYDQEDKHENLARAENDMLWQTGQAPQPQPWEDASVHLRVLQDDMNTMQWKQRALQDEQWASGWIEHYMLTEQAFQASLLPPQVDPAQAGGSAPSTPPPA